MHFQNNPLLGLFLFCLTQDIQNMWLLSMDLLVPMYYYNPFVLISGKKKK